MATIYANLPLNAGDTGITLYLYSLTDGSLQNAGGDAMTEVSNGLFSANVDDADIPAATDLRADARDSGGSVFASDILYSGTTLIGSQPQVTLIDEISNTIGGSGLNVVTATVNDGTANVPNAPVQLLDSLDNPIGYPITSSSSGLATFNLNDGSYKMAVGYLNGYESHVAQVVNVVGPTAVTLTLTPASMSAATDPALCNVLVRVLTQYGQPAVGATVTAKIDSPDFLLNSVVSNDMVTTATTDSNGEVTLSLIRAVEFIRGGKYNILIKVGTSTQKFEYYVPNQASVVATFTS